MLANTLSWLALDYMAWLQHLGDTHKDTRGGPVAAIQSIPLALTRASDLWCSDMLAGRSQPPSETWPGYGMWRVAKCLDSSSNMS